MDKNQTHFTPQFVACDGPRGVRVDDPVEDVQFRILTDETPPVEPIAVESVPWCFPVDSAARAGTNELIFPLRLGAYVRSPDGSMVAAAENDEGLSVAIPGSYTVELTSTPLKLFVCAQSHVEVRTTDTETVVRFPDVDSVALGARSLHKQPARTLTTTRDPEDLMTVASEFGAALKTTSCERSFPTLRGHPPLVEFGDEVALPGGTRRPDTGVRIELPPAVEYVYPAAPLAHYLGAELVPGDTPRLTTRAGVDHELDTDAFATEATRLLRQVFTLDCLTRVEGFYPVDLHERREADRLGPDLDWAALYDQSLAEQLGTYLSVPYEQVEPLIPEWRLTADIVPEMERATVLPHLANELATVRIFNDRDPVSERASAPTDTQAAVEEFVRGPVPSPRAGDFVRSGTRTQSQDDATPGPAPVTTDDIIRVPDADTTTQTYIGDSFPLNANKGSQISYQRQLELRADTPGRISVSVVCNDEEMLDELEVGDHYGTRDLFDFDVELHSDLTRAELRTLFESDTDFLHYIGHVDKRGLQASDGYLDAHTVDDVGTTAFILNGCRSFKQGQALVDGGAIAGIVTLEEVHNSLATQIGTNIARLLNRGWPLDAAVELVKDDALVGRHYVVVGDGSTEVTKTSGGIPVMPILDPHEPGTRFNVSVRTCVTRTRHIGTIHSPHLDEDQSYYIASGEHGPFKLRKQKLQKYLLSEVEPVQFVEDREKSTISLRWSDSIDLDDLH